MKKLTFSGFVFGMIVAINSYAAESIPEVKINQALHDRLPAEIKQSGKMISVGNGSFPPYEIVKSSHEMDGAAADFSSALGQLLGVKIEQVNVTGLSGLLAGINSGRYQFAIGPIGDYPERQNKNDFIDYVKEYVVFGVKKGNPEGIHTLEDVCGKRIAVMSGGSAEHVIKTQSTKCTEAGKSAVQVQSFTDQPSSILAVRSNRTDAFFSSLAPLTYYTQEAKGTLEVTPKSDKNGFGDIYQGIVIGKNSALSGILLDAVKELFANGTYERIMKKWNLQDNMITAPGINLAKDMHQ